MRRSAESMIEHNFSDSLLIVSYALWNLIFWKYLALYVAPILFWSWLQYQCTFNIVPYYLIRIAPNRSNFQMLKIICKYFYLRRWCVDLIYDNSCKVLLPHSFILLTLYFVATWKHSKAHISNNLWLSHLILIRLHL